MNWLDALLLLPLVVGLVRGLMRGLVSEVIAILVVILGVLGARWFAPPFSGWLEKQFAWQGEVCDVVAYVLIFLGIAIILSVLAKLLSKFLRTIHLGWANRLFGGVFGVCKYAIIVLIAVFAMEKTNKSFHWMDKSKAVKTSVVYPYAVEAVEYAEDAFDKMEHK